MQALVPLIVSLLQHSLPFIAGQAPAVAKAVEAIVAIAPAVAQTYADLKPIVLRAIVTLKADKSTTPDQIAELEAAEAILDREFDEAADQALADDAAAGKA